MKESDLQIACVNWFKLAIQNKGLGMIISIPNEGRRTAHTCGKLKRMGLEPGAADLFMVFKGTDKILFVEMKTEHVASRLSERQIAFASTVKSLGKAIVTCRSLGQFIKTVEAFRKMYTANLI